MEKLLKKKQNSFMQNKTIKIFFVKIVIIVFVLQIYSIDFSGNLELLFGSIEKKDTLLSPNNILSISDYTGLLELKTNLNSGYKKMFNIETRARYDFVTKKENFYCDQAYVSYEDMKYLKFRIGRQRLGFGTGYLWNPVNDLDVNKDIYNPAKYVEGVDAIRCNFDFTSKYLKPTNISIIFVLPNKYDNNLDLNYSKVGIQSYIFRDGIEFGLLGSYNKNLGFQDSILYGLFSSIDLYGTIVGLETAISKKPNIKYFSKDRIYYKTDFHIQTGFNINRRITDKSFLIIEYFYNGFGYDKNEFNEITKLLKQQFNLYAVDIINIIKPGYVSKNYFFLSFSYEIFNEITVTTNVISNIDLYGGFFNPQLIWSKFKNTSISLEWIRNITLDQENEFSLIPYEQYLLLRVQQYF